MKPLTNSTEIAEAIVEWARAEIPDLAEGYPHPVGNTTGDLPDVVVAVQAVRVVKGPSEAFPYHQLEQADRIEFDVELSIMVEQGEGVAGEMAAHQQLEAFARTLQGSTVADSTLGSRVPMASPYTETDLAAPFEERANGDRGRALFMAMTITDHVEIEP